MFAISGRSHATLYLLDVWASVHTLPKCKSIAAFVKLVLSFELLEAKLRSSILMAILIDGSMVVS